MTSVRCVSGEHRLGGTGHGEVEVVAAWRCRLSLQPIRAERRPDGREILHRPSRRPDGRSSTTCQKARPSGDRGGHGPDWNVWVRLLATRRGTCPGGLHGGTVLASRARRNRGRRGANRPRNSPSTTTSSCTTSPAAIPKRRNSRTGRIGPVAMLPLARPWLYESWTRLRWPKVESVTGEVDVVHATGLVPAATRSPLVVTVHDLAFLASRAVHRATAPGMMSRSLRAIERRADLVICSSRATVERCVDAGLAADRLRHVPLGVDIVDVGEADIERVRRRYRLPRSSSSSSARWSRARTCRASSPPPSRSATCRSSWSG